MILGGERDYEAKREFQHGKYLIRITEMFHRYGYQLYYDDNMISHHWCELKDVNEAGILATLDMLVHEDGELDELQRNI